MQPLGAQLDEASLGMTARKELHHLVEKARGGHVFKRAGHLRNRALGVAVHRKSELCRNAHGAHHAHRILAVALDGVANHHEAPLLEILKASVVVVDLLRGRVVVHGVDREVAARRVLPHFAKDVVAHDAPVGVLAHARGIERAKGRALDDLVAEDYVHEPKALADDVGATLCALDLLGFGIGGNVEVLGRDAQKKVSHRSAHDEGLEAARLQDLARPPRGPAHLVRINAVLLGPDDAGRPVGLGLAAAGDAGHQLPHAIKHLLLLHTESFPSSTCAAPSGPRQPSSSARDPARQTCAAPPSRARLQALRAFSRG